MSELTLYKLTPELQTNLERHALDFYESPHWFVTDTLNYVNVTGVVGECCTGSGAIASLLNYYPAITSVWTNDIDPQKQADHHVDATKTWEGLPGSDWIITNPPFGTAAAPILINAYAHAKRGVIMFLRQTFMEPCSDRAEFLAAHPPTLELVFPRFKFRKDRSGKRWQTDNCTICAFVWDKQAINQQKIIRKASSISLFHDTPENAPELEEIISFIKKQPSCKNTERGTRQPLTNALIPELATIVLSKPIFITGWHNPVNGRSGCGEFGYSLVAINRFVGKHAKKLNFEHKRVIIDSSAFTRESGFYPQFEGHLSAEEYSRLVLEADSNCNLIAAVSQDYMCEPIVLKQRNTTVIEQQKKSIQRNVNRLKCRSPKHTTHCV